MLMRKSSETTKRRNAKVRSGIHFEALEPRVLLSGEVNPTALAVEGEISAPGEQDRFEFVVEETHRVVFDSITNRSDLSWTLEGPSGRVATSSFYSNATLSSVFELTEGTYRITVDGQNDAVGAYSLRVIDANAAVDLIPGEEVQGTLAAGNSAAVYRFTATAGEQFYFKPVSVQGGYYDARWRLIDPYGRVEGDYTYLYSTRDTFSVQRSGEYLLVVDGYYYNTSPLNYRFELSRVVDSTNPLALDDVTTATIAEVGQIAKFNFHLSETTPVLFERLGETYFYWSLKGPEGVRVSRMYAADGASSYGGSGSGWLLLVAGDYELSIDPVDVAATGAWPFRLLTKASAQTLETGVLTTATLDTPRGTALYRLDLTEGDKLQIDGHTLTGGSLTWRLVDRFGVQIASSALLTKREPLSIDVSGDYWLVLEGAAGNSLNATLNYSFVANKITDVAATLALGDLVEGNIAMSGQAAIYSFDLATATQLVFDAQTNRSDLIWTLVGPRGTEITKRRFDQSDASVLSILDLPPGQYRLTVQGVGIAIGAYAFQLLDLATAPTLALNTELSGTLASGNSTQAWRFEVAAGDKVAFQSSGVTGGSATWRLIDRFGRDVLGANDLVGNRAAVTLTTGGIYTLLIEGRPDAVADIHFNVRLNTAGHEEQAPLPEGDPLILGEVVTGTEKKVWRFTLTEDTLLAMDQFLDNYNYAILWSLSGPRGVEVNRNYLLYSDSYYGYPVRNLPAGEYALTIEGGAYAFRLLDLAEFPAITLGQQDTVVRSPGDSTLGFQFAGTAGETLVLNWSDSTQSSRWTLVDPYGREVSSIIGNNVGTNWVLPVSGTYVLLNENYYPEYIASNNVTFKLSRQEHRIAPLVFNEQVEGAFKGAEDLLEYRFTVEDNTPLVFDDLMLIGNVQWMLRETKGSKTIRDWSNLTASATPSVHTLPPGQYSLFVRSSQDAAATYKFQVLNRETATNFVPGTAVNDSFAAGEAHLYRFNATAGERVYFDGQATSSYNYWQLFDPYGRSVASGYLSSDTSDIVLTTAGEYLLLTYNNSSQNVALSARFNLISRVDSTAALDLNKETSGKIEQPGTKKYNFTLLVPSQILLEGLAGSGLIWSLDGPRGNEVNTGLSGSKRFFNLPAGNYELTLTSNSLNPVDYRLRVIDMAAVLAFETGSETQMNRAADDYFNAYRRIELTEPGQLLLDSLGDLSSVNWELYDASGKSRATGNTNTDTLLPSLSAGSYYLVLNNTMSSWHVALREITYKDAPLELSTLVNDRLDQPGQENRYTFTVDEATTLFFEGLTPGNDLRWELSGQNGIVRSNSYFNVDGASIRLAGAGTYVLRVSSESHVSTDFQFRLLNLSALPTVSLAGAQSIVLDAGQRTQVFAFDSAAWDVFSYQFGSLSENAPYTYFYLLNAEGKTLQSANARYDYSKDLGVKAGRYYIVFQTSVGATPDVTMNFEASLRQDQSYALTVGENAQGYLASGLLEDTWTFSLVTDQRLVFNGPSSSGGIVWELMDDEGRIFSRSLSWNGAPELLDLKAGNYRIVVHANTNESSIPGRYGLQLVDATTAEVMTTEVPLVSGALSAPAGIGVYRFNAQANEDWYVGVQDQGSYITVFDPRGEIVVGVAQQRRVFFNSGTLAGNYLVVVSSGSNLRDDQTYTVTAARAVEQVEDIAIGDYVDGEIAAPYEYHSYHISLTTAAGVLIVPEARNGYLQWRITPAGTGLTQGSWQSWDNTYMWLDAGDYVLTVSGYYLEGGAYQIQLLDMDAPHIDASGDQGILASGRGAVVYAFDVEKSGCFSVEIDTPNSVPLVWDVYQRHDYNDGYYTLYRQLRGNTSRDIFLDPGRYVLVLRGNSTTGEAVEYSLNVQPKIPNVLNFGEIVNTVFPTTGDVLEYRFTLDNPERVFFDALQGGGGFSVSLT
ncbi:hypothetical protein AGMMS49545_09980 [Betaproteobacteria bacterium]|nr:hypothetical protein AGMMS49545_09980 [Betaproteobacteria bacterium]